MIHPQKALEGLNLISLFPIPIHHFQRVLTEIAHDQLNLMTLSGNVRKIACLPCLPCLYLPAAVDEDFTYFCPMLARQNMFSNSIYDRLPFVPRCHGFLLGNLCWQLKNHVKQETLLTLRAGRKALVGFRVGLRCSSLHVAMIGDIPRSIPVCSFSLQHLRPTLNPRQRLPATTQC